MLASLGLLSAVWAQPEIMPLDDIEPGMRGEWLTVVSGTEIERFELEVLGVVPNFVGPQRTIILCEAIDAKNQLTGPVGGMSGSPVYIQNKLVGAYAYGFTWSKEQAIIGVTPIEEMLEVIEQYPPKPGTARAARAPLGQLNPSEMEKPLGEAIDSGTRASGESPRHTETLASLLEPLPTPLIVSGVSPRVLEVFKPQLDELGLGALQAPAGDADKDTEFTFEPGSSVAAVLMRGDFKIAATGTVTYRKGDTLLAFGHPLFQMGPSQFPMAGAEVITVVQSMKFSFKLSNTGPVVGSIYQDRLTGIAGKIGTPPPTTRLSITTKDDSGGKRTFSAELLEHRLLSPLLVAIALLQSLNSTLESSLEQTFYMAGEIAVEGFDSIVFSEVGSGPQGAIEVVLEFFKNYQRLVDNPYERPHVPRIDLTIGLRDQWLTSRLQAVEVENSRVRPGTPLDLTLTFSNYQEERTHRRLAIPLPRGLPTGESLTVLIADAEEAERTDGVREAPANSFADIVEQWRQNRSRQGVYIKLLRQAPGLQLEGENLFHLPPSIAALYTSPNNHIPYRILHEVTLWETQLEIAGEFRGWYRFPIMLE